MNSKSHKLHIYFLPDMAPGHMIPMIDIARLFAKHGNKSTILTTPLNASQIAQTAENDAKNGYDINISTFKFPTEEAGLPEGCENFSQTTTPEMSLRFMKALDLLEEPVEKLLREGDPDCIVVGVNFLWTVDVAVKLKIPRIAFYGTGFFPLCVWDILREEKPHEKVGSDDVEFVVPGIPDEIRLTRKQLPDTLTQDQDKNPMTEFIKRVLAADLRGFGLIVNSFYELEPGYAKRHKELLGTKAWAIGPVSLINKTTHRGRQPSTNNHETLSWLNSQQPNSVIYICFGSMSIVSTPQLHEIAKALESSTHPFIWVIREKANDAVYLPEGFEETIKGRGLIIRGWAPQVQILDHESVGGFVTHCGWNSVIEGVAAGVAMATWPLSSEQFFNEKLVTEILKVGIPVGAEEWCRRSDERGVIKGEKIERVFGELMSGEEGERLRIRARDLGDLAKRAVEEGGSSDLEFKGLLDEIRVYNS